MKMSMEHWCNNLTTHINTYLRQRFGSYLSENKVLLTRQTS